MNQWIGILVGVTALLAFLGTGTVFVLSGRQKVRLSALEASNADLRNDVGGAHRNNLGELRVDSLGGDCDPGPEPRHAGAARGSEAGQG